MPGIDAKSDAIYELVEKGSGVEQVATGFTFTEGPIWHPREHFLLFSDMPGDVRRKFTPGPGSRRSCVRRTSATASRTTPT